MKNRKIKKILIVGYGLIAIRHKKILNNILINPQIMFLRNSNNFKHRNEFFYNIDEVKKYKPDLIIIANPSSLHIKTCFNFIDLNAIFFIEKPISNNLNETKFFVSFCKKNKIKVFVGYNFRFSDSLIFLKKILEKKFQNKINLVLVETGYNLLKWRKNLQYSNTVSAKKKLGGGVLMELSHEVDYLRFIFGEIKFIDTYINKFSKLNIDVEDYANLRVLFYKNQYSKKLFANLNLDFFRSEKKRKLTVIGERETIVWDGVRGTVKIFNIDSNKWLTLYKNKLDLENSYINQWKYFINNMNKNNTLESLLESFKTLSIIIKSIKK